VKNLKRDRMRGSLLRCLLLTGQPADIVAAQLTDLVHLPNVVISFHDYWMPRGLKDYKETTLMENNYFLLPDKQRKLRSWWLEKPRGARVPNWDIASTCTIEGVKGLLLVEAKAHDKELSEAGKSQPISDNSQLNHKQIRQAIAQANSGLSKVTAGWALSRDSHYQLSNRFAWAWKLAVLEVPVILVYLGFLNATEMLDQGQPFNNVEAWQTCIRSHARNIVPEVAWESRLEIDGTPIWFLTRSMRLSLEVVG
jgi:hypothetical protein